MIRVFLVDDHAIIRDGLRMLLAAEADLCIVGTASDGQALLEALPTVQADVVLLDLTMPGLGGMATLPLLQQHFSQLPVIILSMFDQESYAAQALQAGAAGYVLKSANRAEIVAAIRVVATGSRYLSSAIGLALLAKTQLEETPHEEKEKNASTLSPREREVLQLVARGLTTTEIADQLFTGKRTIETHRQNLISKTGAKNTAALIKYAMSQNLLS
jgi:DNA-binding NarL/FixJ family response regulator